MKLPTLHQTNSNDIKSFTDFWSKLYYYPLENLYNETISKIQFEDNDIQRLFIWKNGMTLSNGKQSSLDKKIKSKLKLINSLKTAKALTLSDFLDNFIGLTAVWKIFLLHTIKPDTYPIYDQHIHRAYNFIHGHEYKDISSSAISDTDKEKFYFDTYKPFIDTLTGFNLKKVDEAFFAFGQFLKTNGNARLVE
jgi:hypothetical protein